MRGLDTMSLCRELTVSAAICAVLGAVCFVWFFLPVVTGRILNIGNVTGLAVSACLFFYGCMQAWIHRTLSGLWNRGGLPVRGVLAAAGLLLAAILVTAFVLTCMIVRAACRKPAPDADVIVLGCEVKGNRPSLMLTGRMEAAAAYLREHPGARCVVSGGRGEGEKISEALCMYRYLTGRGIDPGRILQEDRSVSTRENLLFSAKVLRDAQEASGQEKSRVTEEASGQEKSRDSEGSPDLEAAGARNAAIVTNEFHACRALLIAKDLGLEAGAVPAATPWWLFPTFYVRELYGILYQILL